MTKTSVYSKSEVDLQFCTATVERSLANSTYGRQHLTSELRHSPRDIQHHVLCIGGASNITIVLCPLLFFFFSAWNSRCASVCPSIALPGSHRALLEAYLQTEDPLLTRSEYSWWWLISFVALLPNTFTEWIQKVPRNNPFSAWYSARVCLPVAKPLRNHWTVFGLC